MKNTGRILYLSYDGMTDPLGQSQVIPYLAGLSEKGYQITLVSFEKKARFEQHQQKLQLLLQQNAIKWVPLFYTKWPPVFSTVWDIFCLNRKVKLLYQQHSFDIVHCRGYITAFSGVRMKQKWGVRFLFDMRGFFADERVEGGVWNKSNPLFNAVYRYFKRKEILFFSLADAIVSLTNKGKALIAQFPALQGKNLPIEVIPCCADLELFSRTQVDETLGEKFKQKWNIKEEELILSYLGSVGTWYMLDEMLDFFKVASRHYSMRFLFISRENPEMIFRKAEARGIAREKIIVQAAERDQLPSILSVTQLSIFFILPVFSKQASSPTKMGELMGMGIPIVCNSGVGDVDDIVKETGCGLLVHDFSEKEYESIMKRLPAILNANKKAIRDGAEAFYALEKGVEDYAAIYERLSKPL